jgi:hypothetical protein
VSYIIIPLFPPQRHYWFADLQTPFFRLQMSESLPGFHIVSNGFFLFFFRVNCCTEKSIHDISIHVVAICVCAYRYALCRADCRRISRRHLLRRRPELHWYVYKF